MSSRTRVVPRSPATKRPERKYERHRATPRRVVTPSRSPSPRARTAGGRNWRYKGTAQLSGSRPKGHFVPRLLPSNPCPNVRELGHGVKPTTVRDSPCSGYFPPLDAPTPPERPISLVMKGSPVRVRGVGFAPRARLRDKERPLKGLRCSVDRIRTGIARVGCQPRDIVIRVAGALHGGEKGNT
jgi:hypothetical protein